MPRTLTMQRTIIPAADRRKYIERLPQRRAYYEKAGCKFWVFEEIELAGAYIEFIEAANSDTLTEALERSTDKSGPVDPSRIYQEVELK
ncbi:MAG: hypothetical protein ABR543_18330 [Gemmatimonadaceae bacterium]